MTTLRWIIPFICIVATICSVETAKAGSSLSRNNKRVVCYYTNWSAYRPGQAKFLPQNINPYLCTHLIYAFGGFTNDFTLRPFDKWQDIDQGGYAKFNGLKAHNKNLRTLLAIGGWNEGSTRFSKLVADPETRQNLVRSAIKYLRQHQFDGLDLDWEYPASRDGSKPADRENYALLVKDLRDGFNSEKGNRERLLLTMAVPAGVDTIEKGFDIRSLNRDLDFINILSYDYHSSFEPQVNHHAPLRARSNFEDAFDPNEELNIDATVQIYLLNGATADKLVLGIPTYGRAYKLTNPDLTELGSPADGPAEAGKATREKGYLAYYEICEKIGVENWAVEKPDPEAVGPFAHNGIEWVGYDDEDMAAKKAQYVVDNDLGGIMFWSIDNDDFRGQCTGRQYPLIEAAKAALFGTTLPALNQVNAQDRKLSTDTSTANTNTLIRPTLRRPTSNNNNLRTRPSPVATTTTLRTTTSQAGDFNPFTTPEPPTTPDSVVDFECKEEGFYPNPKDCKKYFWCLDTAAGMVSHIFTCPSGLHFNKFTDSCDYANNVNCKTGAGSATTTTPKPFLASTTARATTTTTRATTTRATTTARTTTTTPQPEVFDYVDELEPSLAKKDQQLDSPEELQQLLQLITDLGGVEAVKQLLEKNTGRGRKEDGQAIRLSSAQRQALERVIRPSSSTRGQVEETPTQRPRPNSPQYSTLQRRRPGFNKTQEVVEEATTARSRVAIRTTTEETQPTAQPQATSTTVGFDTADVAAFDYPTDQESADIFGFEEDPSLVEEELPLYDDFPTTTTTTSTTTTTTTTTPAPLTTTTQRRVVSRRRPLNSNRARPAVADDAQTELRASTSRAIPVTSAPRAPIVIAIPAPIVRPVGDDFAKRPVNVSITTVRRPQTANQDDITGDAEVFQVAPVGQNSNGNVVEIDEDGRVFCYDVGNFAYPEDCRKFVQCARGPGRGESEPISGWVHTCPRALSFDPVGAICNWGSPVRCRQFN